MQAALQTMMNSGVTNGETMKGGSMSAHGSGMMVDGAADKSGMMGSGGMVSGSMMQMMPHLERAAMMHSETTTSATDLPPGRRSGGPTSIPTQRRISPIRPHELRWLALALIFNLVWELAQLGFYDLTATHTSVTYMVVHCTLGDGLITVVAYLIVVGVTRSRAWPYTRPWAGMGIMLVSTVGYTALSEWRNVYLLHNWAYAASMPLIVGVGAAPLLQWIVVPVATLITVRRCKP